MNAQAFPIDSEEAQERMADLFGGPLMVDQQIRQAIQFCWRGLPKDRRSVGEMESQIRRLTERALRDFRDDLQAFGKTVSPSA